MKERKQFIFPAFISITLAFVIMFVLEEMQPGLSALAEKTGALFTLGDMAAGADSGSVVWNIIYSFTDFGQGSFLCDTVVVLFMFAGAIINLHLTKLKSPYKGYFMGEIWVWLVCAQAAGMVVANLFWRFAVGWEGWFPTFTPLVSCTPMAILNFGKPNIKKAATGVVAGALFPVFLSQQLILHFTTPYGLPIFVAIGIGMSVSSIIATEIYKLLPWMNDKEAKKETCPSQEEPPSNEVLAPQPKLEGGYLVWLRVWGGDLSELFYWSSNLAGFGVIIGSIISFILNPFAGSCGLLTPKYIFCFILTCSVGMIIWGPKYIKDGMAFTLTSALIMGAILGSFPTLPVLIPLCIVNAFVAPEMLHLAMKTKFFQRYAPAVAVQGLVAILCIIEFVVLKAIGF